MPEDYVFEGAAPDGGSRPVRLSELFAPGKDSLVIYNFMFPRYPTEIGQAPQPERRLSLSWKRDHAHPARLFSINWTVPLAMCDSALISW